MTVSIIIPVYNAEKYLEECLNSAINQTYPHIEIIAVYDGFPDKSPEILQKYSNKIKIVSKEKGNAAEALNAGIKEAKGEWIKRLDVDDVLYPNAIEELISESQTLIDKERTILYSNYDIIDSEGNFIDRKIESNYNKLDLFDFNIILLDHHIGLPSSSLIHKSTIDKFGMFDESMGFEDYELWLRYCILHNCRMHLVPKTLAKYRIHKSQITKTKIKKTEIEKNLSKLILDKLSYSDRLKYEIAIKQFYKNKSLIEKCKFFVRNIIFNLLPISVSNQLVNFYWYWRKKNS